MTATKILSGQISIVFAVVLANDVVCDAMDRVAVALSREGSREDANLRPFGLGNRCSVQLSYGTTLWFQ